MSYREQDLGRGLDKLLVSSWGYSESKLRSCVLSKSLEPEGDLTFQSENAACSHCSHLCG